MYLQAELAEVCRGRSRILVTLCSLLFVFSTACTSGDYYTPPGGDAASAGRLTYEANCQSCHGGATGSDIRDIPPPHNANGHTWHHADQQLVDIVLNGFTDPTNEAEMPAFEGRLTEEQVREVLSYIKMWWTEEQVAWQREVTDNWEMLD